VSPASSRRPGRQRRRAPGSGGIVENATTFSTEGHPGLRSPPQRCPAAACLLDITDNGVGHIGPGNVTPKLAVDNPTVVDVRGCPTDGPRFVASAACDARHGSGPAAASQGRRPDRDDLAAPTRLAAPEGRCRHWEAAAVVRGRTDYGPVHPSRRSRRASDTEARIPGSRPVASTSPSFTPDEKTGGRGMGADRTDRAAAGPVRRERLGRGRRSGAGASVRGKGHGHMTPATALDDADEITPGSSGGQGKSGPGPAGARVRRTGARRRRPQGP